MKDFIISIIKLLDNYKVEYLVVGGCAQIIYEQKTSTRDLDIIINKSEENIQKFKNIIKQKEHIENFLKDKIIRVSGKPYSIDFHSNLDGVDSDEIFNDYNVKTVNNYPVNLIKKSHLEINLKTVKQKVNGIIAI